MSIERAGDFLKSNLSPIGQVSGYGTFAASKLVSASEWILAAKDFVGLIGLTAGATLSCWALYDKWRQKRAEKLRNKALD